MSEYRSSVIAALRRAPGFEHIQDTDCTLTRLGGLTNLVHLVHVNNRDVVVRIAGAGTDEYIDRKVEAHNARAACKAGVSPQVLFTDADTGLMISEAVVDVDTMTPSLFQSCEGAPKRAGLALSKLHNSGQVFEFRFELFSMIDEYLNLLSTKTVQLPEGYHDVVNAAGPIKQILQDNPATLAPCHCDPLCENFLDDGSTMWIVDWEYSGMNDPLWDVGDLCVEAGLSTEQQAELMHAYFGGPPTAAQLGRVEIYKAMCDLLWTLWGLIQHADNNPAEDFWAYSTERFSRCKQLMGLPAFAGHLQAVKDNL
ncbi:MAG: phosphotransferase [Granulosicoccus sp.]